MSSPSPGKRRMDTDVVKLYPFQPKRVKNKPKGLLTTIVSCLVGIIYMYSPLLGTAGYVFSFKCFTLTFLTGFRV